MYYRVYIYLLQYKLNSAYISSDIVLNCFVGQTWFKIPEVVYIEFINEPHFGIGGKDIILYIFFAIDIYI